MKTLAKFHACNHCVIGEKTFKNILIGPLSYRDFRETDPRTQLGQLEEAKCPPIHQFP